MEYIKYGFRIIYTGKTYLFITDIGIFVWKTRHIYRFFFILYLKEGMKKIVQK